jgi:formate-dependent nitrite reductase membrane component NrfD
LLVAALVAGAAALLIVGLPAGGDRPSLKLLAATLIVALVLEAGVLFTEFSGAHANVDAARAARLLTHGALSREFWWGVVVAGVVLPLVLLLTPALPLGPVLALAGLWIYEDVWVKAGQSIPLS